jgi:hypothetical protein
MAGSAATAPASASASNGPDSAPRWPTSYTASDAQAAEADSSGSRERGDPGWGAG